MTKPWEETWTNEGHSDEVRTATEPREQRLQAYSPAYDGVARLAAQAPAMARLLLEHQWCDRSDLEPMGGDNFWSCCPSCGGARTPIDEFDAKRFLKYGGNTIGHAPECVLATVLRAAGVLPPIV